MIVGDYARKYDEQSGQCLSGYYAKQVGQSLTNANYTVDQCYRTCVIKHYYKGLGVGTWASDKKLLQFFYETHEGMQYTEYLQVLIEEINSIRPTTLIGLGEYALRTLTGKESVAKWRGSVLPAAPHILSQLNYPGSQNLKVVCTYHPQHTHIDESAEWLIRLDFKKAVDLIFQPNKPIDYHEIHIARNTGDLLRFLDQYPCDKFPKMTYDIETRYGFITCAGISFDGFKGICIPQTGSTLPKEEKARMMVILAKLLEERDLINQNIGYDKRVSQRFGYWLKKVIWDTMLAAHTIAAEFPKRLDFLTSIYTDMSFYKDEGRDFDPRTQDIEVYYGYNVKDAITTYQIYEKQKQDLIDMGMLEFFTDFVMRLFDMYYDIESVGFKIDLDKRKELLNKYEALYELKCLELRSITERELNLNSPSQIGKFMEEKYFPVLRHRVESGFMVVNTDVESMRKMKSMDDSDYKSCILPTAYAKRFLDLVLLTRRINKIIEYIGVGLHPWDRTHTNPKITGTTSGRTSGSKTADQVWIWTESKTGMGLKQNNLGQSLQTVTKHGFIVEEDSDVDEGFLDMSPSGETVAIEGGIIGKDLREMYIPDEGYAIIEPDLSQAEARVVDVLAEDWEGLEEYGKLDKHCKVASQIFTEYTYHQIFKMAKIDESPEGVFMRQLGKKGKHATNYDMEDFRFSNLANIERKLARTILTKLHRANPNIRGVFHQGVEDIARNTRSLTNPFGRIRMFYKKLDGHGIKVAYSYIPQSTVSDHMKRCMLRIRDLWDNTKAFYIAENHDNFTALVKLDYVKEFCAMAKPILESPIDFRGCSLSRDYQLIIPSDFSIGTKNWGKMKGIKNIDDIHF